MRIWVDADACPVVIREIVYKAAKRTAVQVILVANRSLSIPKSPFISAVHVRQGLDAADDEIVDRLEEGDLVITADIPLADRVVALGGVALNPRGEMYTADNIGERLSTRDFFDSLRSAGVETGGPPALGAREKQAFANGLDTLLTRYAHRS